MPRVCEFYGITIYMYHNEWESPHFHVVYAEHKAKFKLGPFGLEAGSLPPRVERMIREWAGLHESELLENWRRARAGDPLQSVPPLA